MLVSSKASSSLRTLSCRRTSPSPEWVSDLVRRPVPPRPSRPPPPTPSVLDLATQMLTPPCSSASYSYSATSAGSSFAPSSLSLLDHRRSTAACSPVRHAPAEVPGSAPTLLALDPAGDLIAQETGYRLLPGQSRVVPMISSAAQAWAPDSRPASQRSRTPRPSSIARCPTSPPRITRTRIPNRPVPSLPPLQARQIRHLLQPNHQHQPWNRLHLSTLRIQTCPLP